MRRIVIDDLRSFVDDAPVEYYRSSQTGLSRLRDLHATGGDVDELWLDHDLGGADTIEPVVAQLEEWAVNGAPLSVAKTYLHSDNPSPSVQAMVLGLGQRGYEARRVRARDHGLRTAQ